MTDYQITLSRDEVGRLRTALIADIHNINVELTTPVIPKADLAYWQDVYDKQRALHAKLSALLDRKCPE